VSDELSYADAGVDTEAGERARGGPANRQHLKRECVQNDLNIAAVRDEHAEYAAENDKPANDYKHSVSVTAEPIAPLNELSGF